MSKGSLVVLIIRKICHFIDGYSLSKRNVVTDDLIVNQSFNYKLANIENTVRAWEMMYQVSRTKYYVNGSFRDSLALRSVNIKILVSGLKIYILSYI